MAQNKYEVLVAAAGDYIYYNITHHHVWGAYWNQSDNYF